MAKNKKKRSKKSLGAKRMLDKSIVLPSAPGEVAQKTTVGSFLKGVSQLVDSTSFHEAEPLALYLVSTVPSLLEAQLLLARIQMNLYRVQETLDTLERALLLEPNSEELYIYYSMAFRFSLRFEDALLMIGEGLERFPDSSGLQVETDLCAKLSSDKGPEDSQDVENTSFAIVSTVKDVESTIDSFIAYHLDVGFSEIFLFFDDPDDGAIAKARSYPQVTVIINDDALKNRWSELQSYIEMEKDIVSEVMARQVLNVEVAIGLCAEKNIDWLLHVDGDELFYSSMLTPQEHFNSLESRGVSYVTYHNHESVPEKIDIGDCFKEVTLFKKNPHTFATALQTTPEQRKVVQSVAQIPSGYFHFYLNGKSAVRIMDGVRPNGVHRFSVPEQIRVAPLTEEDPVILHYPCNGFSAFWKKYKTLGDFDDKWFGKTDIKDTIGSFHLESRDMVANDDTDAARDFYGERAVIDDAVIVERLLQLDVLLRVEFPLSVLVRHAPK